MTIFKSGVVVSVNTFLSRIFGLFRELFIANLFGTGYIADSVNVAFKLPNLFRRVFAEGAFSVVFIPIFNNKLEISTHSAKKYAAEMLSVLLISLTLLSVTCILLMPQLIYLIAPGFNADNTKYLLTIDLCRITMPYIIFVSITALFGGMLNSVGNFVAFASSPIIMNLGIIIFTCILQNIMLTEYAISYSIVIAGSIQVIIMLVFLAKKSLLIYPSKISYHQDNLITANKFIPALMSSGVMQINLFISQSIASFEAGAVSILSYAERLYQFPLSIIGITVSTILLPPLSKLFRNNKLNESYELQNNTLKICLFLAIPCTVGLALLAHPIVHIIYQRGAFTEEDTLKTANTLIAFACGLPAFIISKVFIPSFYAVHDTKTPFKITVYSLLSNTILNLILMYFIGYLGIAIGSSIAAWINLWLLKFYAQKLGLYKKHNEQKFFFKILFCSFLMAVFIMFSTYNFHEYLYNQATIKKILIFFIIFFTSICIYFFSSLICRTVTISQISNLWKKH